MEANKPNIIEQTTLHYDQLLLKILFTDLQSFKEMQNKLDGLNSKPTEQIASFKTS